MKYILSVLVVFLIAAPQSYAQSRCGVAEDGDYTCGEKAVSEAVEPRACTDNNGTGCSVPMFFSNPASDVKAEQEGDEEAVTEYTIGGMSKMSRPSLDFQIEELTKRVNEITKEIENVPPGLREQAISEVLGEMSPQEIIEYDGEILTRRAGQVIFMGQPL